MEQSVVDAYEKRMEARRQREAEEAAKATPPETEEQKQERLRQSYLKRTGRTAMTSSGTGKGPRIVEIKPD